MTAKRLGIWATAGIASVLFHGGALLALTLATTPDKVDDQPPPKSRLKIESQNVDRATASEAQATAQTAPEAASQTTTANQGAIRQSKATATQLPTQTASATAPTAQSIAAVSNASPTLKPTNATGTPLSAASTTTPSITASQTSTQTTAPSTVSAVQTQDTAPQSIADDTPSLILPAEQGKASLAWSGDGTMDPVSLAAIQAFMQPSDATQNTDTVRDGISAVLAAVPCSRLRTVFVPETGELQVQGHIPDPDMRSAILTALSAQVGTAIPVSDSLLILPRPQCGALSGIADVGLPQSTDQITNPRVVGPGGFARNYTYTDGQRLTLDLTAPDYDGYIYVDYFTADGTVLHLQPNTTVPLEFAAAKSEQSVGKPRDDGAFLELTVSPPYGQEIAAAFASSVPLYEGVRPIQEPAAPYLEFLKDRVATARAQHPDFKGEWVYFFISTKAE